MPSIKDKWNLPLGNFQFNVSLNSYSDITHECIKGEVSSLTAGFQTIWPIGIHDQDFIYPTIANSGDIAIASTDTGDDAASGEGAYTVQIKGIDYNYDQISEVVSLDGQNPVALTNNYLRFHSTKVLTAGDSSTNLGDLYIGTGVGSFSTGVPATIFDIVQSEVAQSNTGIYTVPASHTILVYPPTFVAMGVYEGLGSMFIKPENQVFYREYNSVLRSTRNGDEQIDFPLRFEEKTDIQLRFEFFESATVDKLTARCDCLLIDNTFFTNYNR